LITPSPPTTDVTDRPPVLRIEQLRFGWDSGPELLNIAQLELAAGQNMLVTGASGSGKSTLLNLIGGVLMPTHGEIEICRTQCAALGARRRDRFRAEHLGIVFQQFNLLPFLNVIDNVLLPLQFAPQRRERAGVTGSERHAQAQALLSALGLEAQHWTLPAHRLSVGQQQRAAVARALIGEPSLILADEPTSALDPVNRDRFIELLITQAAAAGSAVLLVSHDPSLAAHFERQLTLGEISRPAVAA